MRLSTQKRILREDLKEAPGWIDGLIDPLNNFMESVYNALNSNLSIGENIMGFYQDVVYKTPSTYPVMDTVKFINRLKVPAKNVQIAQVYEKNTYIPAEGPCFAPWIENSGTIFIYPVTGLVANKIYIVRFLIT